MLFRDVFHSLLHSHSDWKKRSLRLRKPPRLRETPRLRPRKKARCRWSVDPSGNGVRIEGLLIRMGDRATPNRFLRLQWIWVIWGVQLVDPKREDLYLSIRGFWPIQLKTLVQADSAKGSFDCFGRTCFRVSVFYLPVWWSFLTGQRQAALFSSHADWIITWGFLPNANMMHSYALQTIHICGTFAYIRMVIRTCRDVGRVAQTQWERQTNTT